MSTSIRKTPDTYFGNAKSAVTANLVSKLAIASTERLNAFAELAVSEEEIPAEMPEKYKAILAEHFNAKSYAIADGAREAVLQYNNGLMNGLIKLLKATQDECAVADVARLRDIHRQTGEVYTALAAYFPLDMTTK